MNPVNAFAFRDIGAAIGNRSSQPYHGPGFVSRAYLVSSGRKDSALTAGFKADTA